MFDFDDRDLTAFTTRLANLSGPTHRATRGVFEQAALDLKNKWRANAAESSGDHARQYPNSITYDAKFSTDIVFEIGPNDGPKNQGFLGPVLEFGGTHSPPHLDGQRAADDVIPHLERRVTLAAEDVFGA